MVPTEERHGAILIVDHQMVLDTILEQILRRLGLHEDLGARLQGLHHGECQEVPQRHRAHVAVLVPRATHLEELRKDAPFARVQV